MSHAISIVAVIISLFRGKSYLLLTLSMYRQVHKAERRARHSVRSLAFSYKSIPEMLSVCMSRCTVLLRVDLGRPRFLFPVGIHVHACGKSTLSIGAFSDLVSFSTRIEFPGLLVGKVTVISCSAKLLC